MAFLKETYFQEKLDKHSFTEETLQSMVFEECEFTNCSFIGSRFENCRFLNCKFIECDLSTIIPMNCQFTEVQFTKCKAIGIDWTKTQKIKKLSFSECLLNYSNFRLLKLGFPHKVLRYQVIDNAGDSAGIQAGFLRQPGT